MKKYTHALVLGLLLASTTHARDIGYRAHTPAQSPFEVIGSEIPTPHHSSLEYRGRATIQAKYRFVYVETGYSRMLRLDLLPEPESQSLLPYLTRWANESGTSANKVLVTDTAKEIWVTNVGDAAVALLGQALADEVMSGKFERVYGEARIVIEGFTADYTCVSATFATKVVEVKTAISPPAPIQKELLIASE